MSQSDGPEEVGLALPAQLTYQVAITSDTHEIRRILVEELEDIASELTGFDPSLA